MDILTGLALAASLMASQATTPAPAAPLDVAVTDARGRPVADAIVTVEARGSAGRPARVSPAKAPSTHVIDQAGLVFLPYLQVFRPGDRVVFRNSDRTQHHVYSFSQAKAFEFVLKPGESSTPLVLDQVGVISAGCNIHDAMITYLFVTDAPWVERTPASGRVRLQDLPAGRFSVRVWHPRLRPGRTALPRELEINGKPRPLAFALPLLPDPRRRADPERPGY